MSALTTAPRTTAVVPGEVGRMVRRAWPVLILVIYIVAGFGRFVAADFASSDWWPALASNHLQTWGDIPRFFTEPLASQDPEYIRATALHYRPLGTATYAVDYRLWGFDRPWGYQLTDLAFHACVVVATYLLSRELGLPRWASVLAAAVFTSHPAIVGTVPGIGRRFDSLSAALGLASLILLLRGARWQLALASLVFLCSVLAKEVSLVMLPLAAGLLAIRREPVARVVWLLPAVGVALAIRLMVLGSLGGYGTAEVPSPARLAQYRETMVQFLAGFASPGPEIGTYAEMLTRLSVLVVLTIAAAWLVPSAERKIALFGLAWFFLYAEAYAFLRVYNGWYLYQPLIGIGLLVAALAAGGVKRWPSRRGVPALALSASAVLVAVHSSTLFTAYPEWQDVSAQTRAYLAMVDACVEDGNPPLIPRAKGPYADVVEATGLADYSVRAYLQLRYPDGRPCAVTGEA